MKSGTAEQEQKGVMMPKAAAAAAPGDDVAAGQRASHPLGRDEGAQEAHERDDADQEQQHLGQVEEEEGERGAEAARGVEPQDVGHEPVDRGGEQHPGHEPGRDPGRDDEPERRVAAAKRQGRHPSTSLRARRGRVDGRLVPLVVDPARVGTVPAGPHEPGIAQASEVVADVVLALAERGRHLADAVRPVAEDGQDAGAHGVAHEGGHGGRLGDVRALQVEPQLGDHGQLGSCHLSRQCVIGR